MYKLRLELGREIGDMTPSMFSYDQHLPQMRFRLSVAFETVLVSALFLANLAVPPQALQTLGLHLICNILGSSNCKKRRQSIRNSQQTYRILTLGARHIEARLLVVVGIRYLVVRWWQAMMTNVAMPLLTNHYLDAKI